MAEGDRNVYLDVTKVQTPPGRRAGRGAGTDHACDSCGIPARYRLPVISLDMASEEPCPLLALSHCTFCYDSFLEEIHRSQKDSPAEGTRQVFALSTDNRRLAPVPMDWISDQRRALKDTVDFAMEAADVLSKSEVPFYFATTLGAAYAKSHLAAGRGVKRDAERAAANLEHLEEALELLSNLRTRIGVRKPRSRKMP